MRGNSRACIIYCISVICIVVFLTMSIAIGEHEVWACPNCGRTGNTGNYCGSCAHPAPWVVESASEPSSETDTIIPKINAKDVESIVRFGNYEQDNNTGNGKEPIEWLVLDYDAANNRAFLLSLYGLDVKPYNTDRVGTTWEDCTLRAWLNEEFINNAFNTAEQKAILTTSVDNSKSQGYKDLWDFENGNNTSDKIFLLSYAEANKYLGLTGKDTSQKSKTTPTKYAIKQGASAIYTYSNDTPPKETATGLWWLRSPAYNREIAAYVNVVGSLTYIDVSYTSACVRPALWICLDSENF